MKDRYHVTDVGLPPGISCTVDHRMLPMRDGVRLHTMIFFPLDFKGKAPVLLMRNPYTRKAYFMLADERVLNQGIVCIWQACRGTGWSEGVFDPAERDTERNDAEDLLKWIKEQKWFNGRIVMTGASYVGWTQWEMQRVGDPALVGVAPHVATLFSCIGSARPGGGLALSFMENWMLSMHHRCTYGYDGVPNYETMNIFYRLPLIDADKNAGYRELAPVRKFFAAAKEPARVLTAHRKEFSKFIAPALISGGWFDVMKEETFEAFRLMRASAATPEARNFTRLMVGPWVHGGLANPDLFGKKCDCAELEQMRERFLFARLRHPERDPMPGEPVVRYYMIGENRWHEADCWPPAGTKNEKWYLHSQQGANSFAGDGTLNRKAPGEEKADCFISNPNEPVLSDNGGEASLGCYDRLPMEKRSDVLVFTTEKFRKPLAVTGAIKLRFTASATTPDTDFFAVLTDVTPEGKSLFLTSGMIRARYRNSLEKEEFLTPDEWADFEITLSDIAVSFQPGHAMRLEICGQHFPLLARNANTGDDPLTDTKLCLSRLTIRHDAECPAVLFLPVLKEDSGKVPHAAR